MGHQHRWGLLGPEVVARAGTGWACVAVLSQWPFLRHGSFDTWGWGSESGPRFPSLQQSVCLTTQESSQGLEEHQAGPGQPLTEAPSEASVQGNLQPAGAVCALGQRPQQKCQLPRSFHLVEFGGANPPGWPGLSGH